MVVHGPPTSPSPTLMRRIEQFRRERARREAEGYDPDRELRIVLRKYFGVEALEAASEDYQREKHTWLDVDDEPADDDRQARQSCRQGNRRQLGS